MPTVLISAQPYWVRMMTKPHVVFFTEEEIRTLSILCKTALKMSDLPHFQRLEVEAKSSLEKLEKKIREIDDGK